MNLRRQAQPLQLSGRKCRRAALQGEIAESKIQEHAKASAEVVRNPANDLHLLWMVFRELRVGVGHIRVHDLAKTLEGLAREVSDIESGKLHRQRFATEAFPPAYRALGATH